MLITKGRPRFITSNLLPFDPLGTREENGEAQPKALEMTPRAIKKPVDRSRLVLELEEEVIDGYDAMLIRQKYAGFKLECLPKEVYAPSRRLLKKPKNET